MKIVKTKYHEPVLSAVLFLPLLITYLLRKLFSPNDYFNGREWAYLLGIAFMLVWYFRFNWKIIKSK